MRAWPLSNASRYNYEDRQKRQRQNIALAKASGRYAGRKTDTAMHELIAALHAGGRAGKASRKPQNWPDAVQAKSNE